MGKLDVRQIICAHLSGWNSQKMFLSSKWGSNPCTSLIWWVRMLPSLKYDRNSQSTSCMSSCDLITLELWQTIGERLSSSNPLRRTSTVFTPNSYMHNIHEVDRNIWHLNKNFCQICKMSSLSSATFASFLRKDFIFSPIKQKCQDHDQFKTYRWPQQYWDRLLQRILA